MIGGLALNRRGGLARVIFGPGGPKWFRPGEADRRRGLAQTRQLKGVGLDGEWTVRPGHLTPTGRTNGRRAEKGRAAAAERAEGVEKGKTVAAADGGDQRRGPTAVDNNGRRTDGGYWRQTVAG